MADNEKLNAPRKLTMAAARDAVVPASGDYAISDTEYRTLGLGLRVYATGVKTWVARKKVGGVSRRVVLGQFPGVTRDMAIKAAQAVQAEFLRGQDPNRERKQRVEALRYAQERDRVTVALAYDEYSAAGRASGDKPRTLRDREQARSRLEQGELWNTPILQLDPAAVLAEYRRLVAAGKRGTNGGKTQAGATMRWLRAAIRHAAETRKWTLGNPFSELSRVHKGWFKAPARTRIVANTENQLKDWWTAVEALRLKTGERQRDAGTIADFLQLALLLGGRRTELLSLPWSQVNFRQGTLTFVETKNGAAHTIPFGNYVRGLLERRRSACAKKEIWVFPSSRARKDGTYWHIQEPKKTIAAVAKAAGVPFSAHDLRRTFGTLLGEIAATAAVEKALNHTPGSTAQEHYVQARLLKLRALYQQLETGVLAEAGVLPEPDPAADPAPRNRPARSGTRAALALELDRALQFLERLGLPVDASEEIVGAESDQAFERQAADWVERLRGG